MASALPLIVLLCLTIGLLNVSAAKACPGGWTRYGSRCFVLQTRRLPMPYAERNCIRLGGNLASIHNYREHRVVRILIYRAYRSNMWTWIGLSDAIQERMWMWTDGSRLVFTRWARGQPNNLHGREDCTYINFRGNYWNDYNCRARLPSVCVRRR